MVGVPPPVDISGDGRASGWNVPERAERYLERIDTVAPRIAAEEVLRRLLPAQPRSVLDLGCGDGRLAALVLESCPSIERVVAVDLSPPMLARARERFDGDRRVEVRPFDLADSLQPLGTFDVIVSGFAIHHLMDDRKRRLFTEVARQLHPDGLFVNLEVVASSSPELHATFLGAIGRSEDDPEDRLVDTELQAGWMREAGLTEVHCRWRWRGFALLVGQAGPNVGSDHSIEDQSTLTASAAPSPT
jgi:tRNA (cmo5U34)-methyltransferase